MKKIITSVIMLSALAGTLAPAAFAADAPAGTAPAQHANLNRQQDPYHQQMAGLMEEMKNAK